MFRLIFTALASFLVISGCAQNKTPINKEQADALHRSMAERIRKYDSQPYYTLQVNKQVCRVLIRINDLPLWYDFFEDEGESLLLPINDLIPQSGEQHITVEVYPRSIEKTLSDKAHVNVKLIYAPDRNTPMNEFQVIAEYNLPEALGDQKLPRYDVNGVFNAHVPFDFSHQLQKARDLTKVPDIEKK
ncbi:MAG: hypothetical protein LUE98_09495 [Tannerellaceae bacterium]|nr:hypothetical protein [Tannerellaceae bacterium]